MLFYTHTGTFEEDNLEIHCQDIFPMDLGTGGWTEFKMTPDVTAYIAENLDLFQCETGLIHSHHTMGAFFSGQDQKTLQVEGNDTNCFVSLIVDTKGTYVAAITRKVQSKTEITKKSLGTLYQFFGEGAVATSEDPMTETTEEVDAEVIEYFMLDVEREEVENHLAWLDTRFEEIEASKRSAQKVVLPFTPAESITPCSPTYPSTPTESYKKEEAKELSFWDKDTMDKLIDLNWVPDPETVHNAVVRLLTCSLIINPSKIDIDKWVRNHMQDLYDRMFADVDAFDNWSDFITDFTMDHFQDPTTPDSVYEFWEEYQAQIANAIITELMAFKDVNNYVNKYIYAFERYIV